MSYKKTASQIFIDCAKKIYLSLTLEERKLISYPDFIDKVTTEYSGFEGNSSNRSTGYRHCNEYYHCHPLTKKNPRAKSRNEKVRYEDIHPLLDYDTRREQLINALGNEYRYSWFSKNVYVEDGTKKGRIFLIIESKEEVIKNIYEILSLTYTEMFKSMYVGYGGLVLIFYNRANLDKFIEYIKKEN